MGTTIVVAVSTSASSLGVNLCALFAMVRTFSATPTVLQAASIFCAWESEVIVEHPMLRQRVMPRIMVPIRRGRKDRRIRDIWIISGG